MIINVGALDYMTVTTYDKTAMDALSQWGEERIAHYKRTIGFSAVDVNNSYKMQYSGLQCHVDGVGSIYFAKGEQNARHHWIIQASSLWAGQLFSQYKELLSLGTVRCTRLDLQITVEQSPSWCQFQFAERVRDSGKSMGFIESKGTNYMLATVYIGQRVSDRYVRVYQKEGDNGELYLRFEVEMKGERAAATAEKLARGTMRIESVIKYEMLRIKDISMMSEVGGALEGVVPQRAKIVRCTSLLKTEKWIVRTVLPALTKWAARHDSDKTLLMTIQKELENAAKRQ